MRIVILKLLLVISTSAAQPIGARDELWHPTNPPKKVSPGNEKAAGDALMKAQRNQVEGKISPDESFLRAYKTIQVAQENVKNKEYAKAKDNLTRAISILSDLRTQSPQWAGEIVKYRIDFANSLLASLPAN